MRTMHLFAGHGGGLLADLILGHTPVVAVEWDRYACQVLRERAADGWFPGLQVWEGDVRLFNPSEYAGSVDIIHAGFPCQDISAAGKQAGVSEGTRSGLYREVLRIAGVVRPRIIFLENVAAILSNGLGTVLGDLAAMGYDTRWLCIRASDVGAPHHRDRWFALARQPDVFPYAEHNGAGRWEQQQEGFEKETLAHSNNGRWGRGAQRREGGNGEPVFYGEKGNFDDVPHTERQRLQGQREYVYAEYSAQSRDRQATEFEHGGRPEFWSVESSVGRVANGVPNRIHRLKGLGNAQAPLQAATAWKLLGGP